MDLSRMSKDCTGNLGSATRLTLLEVLSAATANITRDLAPGSVEVRLRGRDPEFVVSPPSPALPPSGSPDIGLKAFLVLTAATMITMILVDMK
jgi:hypothetical protein